MPDTMVRRSTHETRRTVSSASTPREASRPTRDGVPSLDTNPDNPSPLSFHCHETQYCSCPARFRYTPQALPAQTPAGVSLAGLGSMHHGDRSLRALGHARRRPGALDGLRLVPARRPESGDHSRAHHGPRRRPERRSLLRDSTAAGFLAGALDNTIIVAPHFIAAQDKPSANEIMWPEGGRTLGDPAECRRRIRRSRRSTSWMRSPQARRQEDFPQPHEDRRRRALGRRPGRDAIRDGEQGSRHARA